MTTPSPSEVRAAQAMNQCPHCGSKNVTWNWCHDGSVWYHECWDCGNVFRTLGRSGRGEMSEKYDLIYDGRDIRRRILHGTLKDIFLQVVDLLSPEKALELVFGNEEIKKRLWIDKIGLMPPEGCQCYWLMGDNRYRLILDPPEPKKIVIDGNLERVTAIDRSEPGPHKFGDDNPDDEPEPQEDEYERWCQDFTTALRHVDNMDSGWSHVLNQLKRMPR